MYKIGPSGVKKEQCLLERTEMMMFRWMMVITRIEKIRTEETRTGIGVANKIGPTHNL